jgi:transposase
MGTSNYSDEFKRDAVHQITVRGYPVREVSRRLGVSKYSLYKWVKLFGEPSLKPGVDHEAENRRLKRELARVTEERDIPKKGNGVLRARVPMKYAFIQCLTGHCAAMSREGGRIARSSASGPCAGCCGSTSPASMHGSRSR